MRFTISKRQRRLLWLMNILTTLAVLAFAAALLFAQDEGATVEVSGAPIDVLPLSLVTDSAPVVLDITDTTARVNFIGTEALACYLIYGTDETYGDVTNDPDMAQAAIIEHNPIMVGLEPETEYTFRMMGTSEDGQLYVSEVYTFTTTAADTSANANLLSPDNGTSVVEVSSNFGDGPNDGRWGVLNAFDSNTATEWSSNGDGDDAFFVVEFDAPRQINELEFQTRAMSDGTAITSSFTVTADDGTTYGPFVIDGSDISYTFDVNFVTETLRYDVEESTGGNTGIVDIAAYGEPAE
ncbi:MAG: discoidin domain-containing protein [Chloroflexota bacterium]